MNPGWLGGMHRQPMYGCQPKQPATRQLNMSCAWQEGAPLEFYDTWVAPHHFTYNQLSLISHPPS